MTVVILQIVQTLVALTFGVVSLLVAARLRPQPLFRLGWLWVGAGFTAVNIPVLAQTLFAAAAFVSGPDTPLWNHYLLWAPLFNHGHTAALICVFVVLLVLVLPRGKAERGSPTGRAWLVGWASVLGGALLGSWLGMVEGSILSPSHLRHVVIMNAVEVFILLAGLFLLLVRDRMDRILWSALAVYAANVVLHIVLVSAMIGFGIAGGWRISPFYAQFSNTAFVAVMVMLALLRLWKVRGGAEATGLFRPVRRRVSLF